MLSNHSPKRTIVQNIRAVGQLPHLALSPAVFDYLASPSQFITKSEFRTVSNVVKMFDIYLYVTGQPIKSVVHLSSDVFSKSALEFFGAIHSNSFFDNKLIGQYFYAITWYKQLLFLEERIPEFQMPTWVKPSTVSTSWAQHLISNFEARRLCIETCWVSRCWPIKNKKGVLRTQALYPLYKRMGASFTNDFYDICATYLSGYAKTEIEGVSAFASFVGEYNGQLTPESLKDNNWISRNNFWSKFMEYFFVGGYKGGRGASVDVLIQSWRSNVQYFMINHVIDAGFIAAGYGAFPMPPIRKCKGGPKTNIRVTEDGVEVHEKLLTAVPLEVTDAEAVQILFHDIRSDVDTIKAWAEHEAQGMWNRYENQQKLASTGQVMTRVFKRVFDKETLSSWVTSLDNPQWAQNAAATFQHYGYLTRSDFKNQLGIGIESMYPKALRLVSKELGLPQSGTFIPFVLLLAAEMPQIFEDCHLGKMFLTHIEAFDEGGKPVWNNRGFLVSYSGWARQFRRREVPLTPKAIELIERWIKICQPVREYLKQKRDPAWGKLWLSCGQGFDVPKVTKELRVTKKSPAGQSLRDVLNFESDLTDEQKGFLSTELRLQELISKPSTIAWAEREVHAHWKRSQNREILAEQGTVRRADWAGAINHKRRLQISGLLTDQMLTINSILLLRFKSMAFRSALHLMLYLTLPISNECMSMYLQTHIS